MRAYGLAELGVGVGGLLVPLGLAALSGLDTRLFQIAPGVAPAAHLVGLLLILLAPAIAMGATLPLLAACAPRLGASVPALYALNVCGAVLGVLVASFLTLPLLGVTSTELLAALERSGAAVYHGLAEDESDPDAKAALLRAAEKEGENAEVLEGHA